MRTTGKNAREAKWFPRPPPFVAAAMRACVLAAHKALIAFD